MISMAVGLMILSISVHAYLRMDYPLFLKYDRDEIYYKSEEGYKEYRFKLEYITNDDIDTVVEQIEFPEHPQLQAIVSEVNYPDYLNYDTYNRIHSGSTYGTYNVRQLYILLRDSSENRNEEEPIIRQAKIYFSDRTERVSDIGELHLKNNKDTNESLLEKTIEHYEDGIGEVQYRVLKPIKLKEIDQNRIGNYQDNLQVKLEQKPLEEIEGSTLQENEEVVFYTELKNGEDLLDSFVSVDFSPDTTLIDEEGHESVQSLFSIRKERTPFNFKNIHRYVKNRTRNE
ncbi:hypothetical protein VXN63_06170 [Marinilactibacillus sp. XAAS-LB27]|uniref:hypothetical protein n=1 Tax=Marinilactibacillus sp. XAAS-LB27 TaxID=3114538 RepID=UPI002E178DE7|nr:hypothetical protein [Marinilactibacillus sp. XAAS-LB27]